LKKRFKEPYSDPRWWYGGKGVPKCFDCVHFQGLIKGNVRCTLFTDGIPKEIFSVKYFHSEQSVNNNCDKFEKHTLFIDMEEIDE